MPARRALVAVQPDCTDWGSEATPAVQEAIPRACEIINTLAHDWIEAEAA